MSAIIGASIFSVVVIMSILVTLGFPFGEFTMGGKYKILPLKMRIASGISVLIQMFAIFVILQAGEIIDTGLPFGITRGACFFFAVYLTVNVIMNFLSTSKKEKYVMTPLSLIAAFCFWITAVRTL